MKNEEPKRCPFCGKLPKAGACHDYKGESRPKVPHWFVYCYKSRDHDIQVGGRTKQEAIRKWNKRQLGDGRNT